MSGTAHLIQALEGAFTGFCLYPLGHTRQEKAVATLTEALTDIFSETARVIFGIADGTIVCDGVPLFEDSAYAVRFIDRLEARGVATVCIEAGVSKDDVRGFMLTLARRREGGTASTLNEQLLSQGITSIQAADNPMKETAGSSDEEEPKLVTRISNDMLAMVQDTLEAAYAQVSKGGRLDADLLREAATDLGEAVRKDKQEMLSLVPQTYHDHYTYNHSINTCLLATALAETFISSKADLHRISQAALLHDVGKVVVPELILFKPGKLDAQEWEVMKDHPRRGAEILLEAKRVDPLCILVAQGHHRRFDGSGYPGSAAGAERHPVVAIVAMIDVYEAMTAQRPYKPGLSPSLAVSFLLRQAGKQFDPAIVRAFVDMVGVYPAGSTLEFTSGEQARVLKIAPGEPEKAEVAFFMDGAGNAVDPPDVVALDFRSLPPHRSITLCRQTDDLAYA